MITIKYRTLVILAAASLVAGSAIARSDCAPGREGPGRFAGHTEKHLEKYRARLHDTLKLSTEQEAAWKTFTDKTQLPAVDRAKLKAQRSELRALPAPARMDRMIARMKEREGRMLEWAAAVKEFYAQLTPEQQTLFDAQHRRPMRKR